MNHKIPTLNSIKQLREPLKNVRNEHRRLMSKLDKFALWVTKHVGSAGFFALLFLWTIGWLSWNTFAPPQYHFDPYPAFVLWIFISNLLQVFLIPLIMIGQNIENKHHDIRAELDYQVNKTAQSEIELVLAHLERQQESLNAMHELLNDLQKRIL